MVLHRQFSMKFFGEKILLSIIFWILSIVFIQQIFSQEEWFGILEITFHTWLNSPEILHLQETIDISSANLTWFRVQIKNTSKDPMLLKLDFWTQIQTNDTENILWCQLWNNSQNPFPQNMIFDTWDFQVSAYSWVYKYIETNYTACASGASLWCIAVQQAQNTWMWIFDIELSRVWFLDFDVISDIMNCNNIGINVFQEKRNLFPSAGKVLPNQKTSWILWFYNTDWSFVTSGRVNIWREWSWETNINRNLSWAYIVTFQWLSSTKSMISWIIINSYNRNIDFTTGQNIFGTVIEDRDEDSNSDDWWLYQRVWEIDPYDWEINWDDIAKILPVINRTNQDFWLNKYDIDADWWITIADIWIIIYNLHKRSVWYEYSDTGLLPWMNP